VETSEGHGVIHAIVAWRPRDGYRQRPFLIPKAWLHAEWEKIHGAWATSVEKVSMHAGSARGISRYIANQYLASQTKEGESALVRIAGSWRRTFGFSLGRAWSYFKRAFPVYLTVRRDEAVKPGFGTRYRAATQERLKRRYEAWTAFLAGRPVVVAGEVVTPAHFLPETKPVVSDWWFENYGPQSRRWL
jgi:hypothetical protein